MTWNRKNPGARRHVRVDLYMPGFLIPAPDAPWIECTIVDVSDSGVSVDVGSLPVPKVFGLAFTSGGEVIRICVLTWRRGELVGGRFVRAKDLRQRLRPDDARDGAKNPLANPSENARRIAGRR
jgi:hypothetical protein